MKPISYLFTFGLVAAAPAFAGPSWVPAGGEACTKVCKEEDKLPVTLRNVAGNPVVEVCAGEPPAGDKDKNPRPGFTTVNEGIRGCAVFPGRASEKFSCLCLEPEKKKEEKKSD